MPRISFEAAGESFEMEQTLNSTPKPKRTANWTKGEELRLCYNIHNIVIRIKNYLDINAMIVFCLYS